MRVRLRLHFQVLTINSPRERGEEREKRQGMKLF